MGRWFDPSRAHVHHHSKIRRSLPAVAALVAALVLAVGGSAHAGDQRPRPSAATSPSRSTGRPPIVISVLTRERVVALSFDDGPDPRWTPAIVEALAAAGARATFFVTGEHASAHPDLLRAVATAGHEVANHTETHPNLDRMTAAAVRDEIRQASRSIAATGLELRPFFRPPRGRYDTKTLTEAEAAGLGTIGWSVCLERWLRRSGPMLGVDDAVEQIEPGAILLAHDGGIPDRAATVAALPLFLARLDAAGYRVVTISELIELGPTVKGRPGAVETPPTLAVSPQVLTPRN